MQKVQAQLWPKTAEAASGFQVVPTPYLPVFLVPFQLLSLLQPARASWVWMALNLLATVFYLRYLGVRISGRVPPTRLLAMLLVSVPVFSNLFVGQVNTWLMICVGQYMLAAREGKPFKAGLWLGGLLLKPQSLVVIVPAILLHRSMKSLAGLTVTGAAIGGASLGMVGPAGLIQIARLWLGYAGGIATNYPELMMNWRMVGLLIFQFAGRSLASTVTAMAMAFTLLAALYLWRNLDFSDSARFSIALAGTFAATGLVAWHSHVHMAMILIPPLMYAYIRHRETLGHGLEWWIFLPASVYAARLLLAAMVRAGILAIGGGDLDFFAGMGLFVVNVYLVVWAVGQSRRVPALAAATR